MSFTLQSHRTSASPCRNAHGSRWCPHRGLSGEGWILTTSCAEPVRWSLVEAPTHQRPGLIAEAPKSMDAFDLVCRRSLRPSVTVDLVCLVGAGHPRCSRPARSRRARLVPSLAAGGGARPGCSNEVPVGVSGARQVAITLKTEVRLTLGRRPWLGPLLTRLVHGGPPFIQRPRALTPARRGRKGHTGVQAAISRVRLHTHTRGWHALRGLEA